MPHKHELKIPGRHDAGWRRSEPFLLLGGGLAIVLLMHQPTWESLTTTLPGNLGDPTLATWILNWEVHALTSEPLRFFDGNIFHPFGEAIKYSEMMLPMVPLFGLVLWVSDSPLFAHNVVILGLSLFCLVTTYLLARRLTGRLVAMVATASFTFSSFVFAHQTHLQLLALGFFPLAFLCLFRALKQRRIQDGLWLGLVTSLLTTGSFYYGAIWIVSMGTIVLWDLARLRRPSSEWWKSIGTAVMTSTLLLAPFVYVYAEFQSRVPWTRDTSPNVLHAIDFLTPAPQSLLYEPLFHWANSRSSTGLVEHGFFPGFVVLLLSLVGAGALLVSWRKGSRDQPANRIYELRLLGLAGVVSLVLSLGPNVAGVPMPFAALRHVFVGFDSIRATSRLAVPFMLMIALYAAWGLNRAIANLSGMKRAIAAVLISVAVLGEMWVEPIRAQVEGPAPIRAVLEKAGPGAVLELPMREIPDSEYSYIEGPRLMGSIGDWRPRFNGFSGGFPPGYIESIPVLLRFPDPTSLAQIRTFDIRFVLLHGHEDRSQRAYSFREIEGILAGVPDDAVVRRVGSDWLIDLGRV